MDFGNSIIFWYFSRVECQKWIVYLFFVLDISFSSTIHALRRVGQRSLSEFTRIEIAEDLFKNGRDSINLISKRHGVTKSYVHNCAQNYIKLIDRVGSMRIKF